VNIFGEDMKLELRPHGVFCKAPAGYIMRSPIHGLEGIADVEPAFEACRAVATVERHYFAHDPVPRRHPGDFLTNLPDPCHNFMPLNTLALRVENLRGVFLAGTPLVDVAAADTAVLHLEKNVMGCVGIFPEPRNRYFFECDDSVRIGDEAEHSLFHGVFLLSFYGLVFLPGFLFRRSPPCVHGR
jgi:hypothetical protein